MIEPVVKEADWLLSMRGFPEWVPSCQPMLIIAPHPDDETLGAGGLIAAQRSRDIEVTVVAVTDGERAYPDSEGLGNLRRVEQENALTRLGVQRDKVIRLELPDSNVDAHQGELTEKLIRLVTSNAIIVAPWQGDFHPDHQVCGRVAETVARVKGAPLISYFFWTWHMSRVEVLDALQPRTFPLTEDWFEAKCDALREYQSQLSRADGEPILSEELLGPAKRRFEVFSIR